MANVRRGIGSGGPPGLQNQRGAFDAPGGFDSRPLPPSPGRAAEVKAGPRRLDVALVGGGHVHVEVLRRAAMKPMPGVRLTVVARDATTPYSGMLPGYLAGIYTHEEAHIDLRPLCARAGARLLRAPAAGLDADGRRVLFTDRPPLRFDIAAIDVGSTPDIAGIEGAETGLPVKPVDRFLERWRAFEDEAAAGDGPWRLVTVGGGAGGVELCLGLRRRLARRIAGAGSDPDGIRVRLVAETLLPGHGTGARRRLLRALEAAGVEPRLGRRVAVLRPGRVVLDDGVEIPSDATVLATGPAAPAWLRETGLRLDDGGFVAVDRCLRSLSHPFVFAAGDAAGHAGRPIARNGVHAVRQGPVLARNLRALADGRSLEPYRPQGRTMALISTGRRHAIGSWGDLAFAGDWAWRWKDRIDRRWMDRYRRLPAMPETTGTPMRCGGCGAKAPARVLRRALARLDAPSRDEVLTGLDAPDDAAVLRPPPGKVAVQTIDHFPAFLDDPWLFGRVAAVHALSDIHAMGAEPVAALALAGLLPGGPEAMEDDLVQMLSGVSAALREEGCALVGGHTGESERAALGLAVTGFADEGALIRKSGLAPGDALVLTKPLGTGALFAADMRGEARSPWIEAALDGMLRSNGPAARLLAEAGASAMTDVTGFGLAGHLLEMAAASNVSAVLRADAAPAYPGARELLARGVASTLHPGNAAALEGRIDTAAADPLLFDPQTSGGLLAGVAAERAGEVVRRLRANGDAASAVVGRVAAFDGAAVRLA